MEVIKNTEEVVLSVLEVNLKARDDDFILYGSVLKRLGVDLIRTNLYEFLSTAKEKKMPTFETVTRCRRHVQELEPRLKGSIAVKREQRKEDFRNYNITGIGGTR